MVITTVCSILYGPILKGQLFTTQNKQTKKAVLRLFLLIFAFLSRTEQKRENTTQLPIWRQLELIRLQVIANEQNNFCYSVKQNRRNYIHAHY